MQPVGVAGRHARLQLEANGKRPSCSTSTAPNRSKSPSSSRSGSCTSRSGTFGTIFTARIPKIAGESGYVTNLSLTFSRTYQYQGERRSFLSARCAAPSGSPVRSSPSPAAASPSPTASAWAPRSPATAGSAAARQGRPPRRRIGWCVAISAQSSCVFQVWTHGADRESGVRQPRQTELLHLRCAACPANLVRGHRAARLAPVAGPAAFAVASIVLLVYDHLQQRVPHILFWLALALIGASSSG